MSDIVERIRREAHRCRLIPSCDTEGLETAVVDLASLADLAADAIELRRTENGRLTQDRDRWEAISGSRLAELHDRLDDITRLTEERDALVVALGKIVPIRVHNGPDYAEVYFADGQNHSTQAMTMNPQDWLDIDAALAKVKGGPDAR